MKLNSMSFALVTALALGVSGCAMFNHDSGKTAKSTTDTSGNPRGAVTTVSDAAINSKVKAVLAADDLVKARNIDTDTVRGVVTLNGTVHSMAEKNQALSLARKVDGVVSVKDNLKMAG